MVVEEARLRIAKGLWGFRGGEAGGRGRCITNGFLKRLQHVAPSS